MAMGMQGWRRSMEDSHIAHMDLENGCSLFGVFDGHGGGLNTSRFVAFCHFGSQIQTTCGHTCYLNLFRTRSSAMGQRKL